MNSFEECYFFPNLASLRFGGSNSPFLKGRVAGKFARAAQILKYRNAEYAKVSISEIHINLLSHPADLRIGSRQQQQLGPDLDLSIVLREVLIRPHKMLGQFYFPSTCSHWNKNDVLAHGS